MTDEIKHERCGKCKCWRTPDLFLNDKGRKLKTCQKCRDLSKKNREKNKCEHNRKKSQCKDCGGASICEHNRVRSHCKDCGGASICEHNRIRSKCKDCDGGSICEHKHQKAKCNYCSGKWVWGQQRVCLTVYDTYVIIRWRKNKVRHEKKWGFTKKRTKEDAIRLAIEYKEKLQEKEE